MNQSKIGKRPFTLLRSPRIYALLFLFGLLPRLAAVGQYITPDELNWVHRSVLFHQALGAGEWGNTLTSGHPGVITTWLGAIGLQLQLWLRPSDWAAYEWITRLAWLAPENTAAFPQLATFLTAGRIAVAVVNSLGILAIVWLAKRIVQQGLAVGLGVLIALDPFVAGLSGLLHVDGLMTTFSTISLLALAGLFADEGDQNWKLAAVSGAAAGGAILAKSTALTMIPFVGLMFGIGLIWRRNQYKSILGLGLIWILAGAAMQLMLLPALWDSPLGVYETIFGTILHEAEEVLPTTFFLGKMSQAHGAIFYPIALFYRLNPIVFLGVFLSLWFGWKQKSANKIWRWPLPWLAVIYIFFFILVLSLATKKFDRYLLPAMPMVFLIGLAGWSMLFQRRPSWTRKLMWTGGIAVLLYLGTAVPYLLNAYNPIPALLMPTRHVMPLGWGEGVSAAAKWLAEQPDAVEKTAEAGIGPAFAPFFPGETILGSGPKWKTADFIVETLGGHQDRQDFLPPSPMNQTLLHTIRFDGQDQAWIFANDDPIDQAVLWAPQAVRFGEQIQLVASDTAVQGSELTVLAQWQLVQQTDDRFMVQFRLMDEIGQLWSQSEMPLLNEVYFYPEHWQLNEQPIWEYVLPLPLGMPPGKFQIELSLFSVASGGHLPVLDEDGRFLGVNRSLAEVMITPPPLFDAQILRLDGTPNALLNGDLQLLSQANLPESVLTAGSLPVELFWQSTAVLPANLYLQFAVDNVHLTLLPLSRFDTDLWQPGQIIREKYQVPIPAELSAGEVQISLELIDSSGRSLGSSRIDLGTIKVVSPDRLFTLPEDIRQPLNLQFDELVDLRGYDLPTASAVPGEVVEMTLYWQVDRQPDEILSTFVHVVGPDGRIVVQGDQWPGGLPGTTWVENQVIVDAYAIQLPDIAPLGSYKIVLGLYSPANGVRLPILAEDGQPLPNNEFALPLEVISP